MLCLSLKEAPYKDSQVDNIVILSRADHDCSEHDEETCSSDFYAYGYTNDGAKHSLSCKMHDYIHKCYLT